mmetsp:Transcript_30381/g.46520  ORF Transcript_30381/g.46520 Transcript_30381/m.46520 type:complete len:116 (+) Transcript_30381:13-360(+)
MKTSPFLAAFLLVHSAKAVKVHQQMATELGVQAQALQQLDGMSLSFNVAELDLDQKNLLKNYLHVELNEFFQEKLDSDMFEDVDEAEKSQFIGNLFKALRNIFVQKTPTTDFTAT